MCTPITKISKLFFWTCPVAGCFSVGRCIYPRIQHLHTGRQILGTELPVLEGASVGSYIQP